jgi:hypothetical protein
VLGFLSGIASGSVHILGSQNELDATAGIDDVEKIFRWIDRYCVLNRSKLIADAAVQFFSFGLGCTKILPASGFKIPFRNLPLQGSDDRACDEVPLDWHAAWGTVLGHPVYRRC